MGTKTYHKQRVIVELQFNHPVGEAEALEAVTELLCVYRHRPNLGITKFHTISLNKYLAARHPEIAQCLVKPKTSPVPQSSPET